MPVYNGEAYLAEAIESILGQSFADFEFIIVDDASTDGSLEIAERHQRRDRRVQLIALAENGGAGSARNRGIASAQGQYVAAMDADDVSHSRRLEKQVDFLNANPDIGLVGTCAQFCDADLNPLYDFDVPQAHAVITLYLFFRPRMVAGSMMLRRHFLGAVGGYRPGARSAHDLDLQARLLVNTSIRFANLPEALYRYRRHGESASMNYSAAQATQTGQAPRARLLEYLWGEAPADAMARFHRLRQGAKLGWAERRRARRDMQRLIRALIAKERVDKADEILLYETSNRLLEETTPRLWQKWLHWRRHNLGR